jgi:hypothetical protein
VVPGGGTQRPGSQGEPQSNLNRVEPQSYGGSHGGGRDGQGDYFLGKMTGDHA